MTDHDGMLPFAPSTRPRILRALAAVAALAVSGCVTTDETPEPSPAVIVQPDSTSPIDPTASDQITRMTFPTTCYGDPKAERTAVFLHGIQSASAPAPATVYGPRLARLAKETGYRIAMPVSRLRCRAGSTDRCWSGDTPDEVAATFAAIARSTAACFANGPAPFGLIGFSNGGYHAGRVAMRCADPKPRWIIAIGSAGDIGLAASDDLSACAPTTILIGTADVTRRKAQAFAAELQRLRLPVTFATFAGGHDVPWDELTLRLSKAR